VKYRLRCVATHRALQQIEADFFNKNNPSFGVTFFEGCTNHQLADSLFQRSQSFGSVLLQHAIDSTGNSSFLDSWYVVLTLT
jgi:hypothetical protein